MDNDFFHSNHDNILEIAQAAGDAIMEIYTDTHGMGTQYKEDNSPLTLADLRAHDIIVNGLAVITPDIPIISEESELLPYDKRRDAPFLWMVDPLDGTKEFIHKRGDFTVNIALIHQERSVAGYVYAPVYEALYYAWENQGAYCKDRNGIRKLSCTPYEKSDSGIRIVCSKSHLSTATQSYMSSFTNPHIVEVGSSLKFLQIAEGKADIYPRLGPTSEWDTAAAQIILEEAGGSVTDASTGDTMRYNKSSILNNHFIAKGKEVL